VVTTYQDFKYLAVTWFIYPALIFIGSYLFFNHVMIPQVFWVNIFFNLILCLILLGVLFMYSKYVLRTSFLNTTFGIGDVLFLTFTATSLPTMAFIVLVGFSLLFSVITAKLLLIKTPSQSIPLAGIMSLFFSVVFIAHLTFSNFNVYAY